MKRTSEFKDYGTLYLISTPIGNLGDFSKRAIETLKTLDFLFCEDTRVTHKLLSHYDIMLECDSYHDHSDESKEDKIIGMLKDGKNVGLVSDAGTPIISDPGFEIVRKAVDNSIRVIPIPGATAQVTALTLSALPPKPYLYYGFLDHNDKKKKEELESLKDNEFTMVFYESPLRIKNTLSLMYKIFGERKATVSRELTKIYEETIYLNLSEFSDFPDNLKGEMVLVVEGKSKEEIMTDINVMDEMNRLIESGISIKEASKTIAKKYNLKSSEIYNDYVKERK